MKLSDYLVPSAKYSNFRCDTYKKFSASPGLLYPVWMNILNPGESASIDFRHVIRTWPVESPLMGSMKVRFVTVAFNLKNYAIALEGYKRSFDWRSTSLPVITFSFDKNSDYSPTRVSGILEGVNPFINYAYNMCVKDCSLFDYLGYESGWLPSNGVYPSASTTDTVRVYKSFLPFLCYYDFYRNYLVNPQESVFPLVHARLGITMMKDMNGISVPIAVPYSAVSMLPITSLDDMVETIHKTYDGSDSVVDVRNACIGNQFFDLFNTTFDKTVISNQINSVQNISSVPHGGLVSTMFDSDINTQWMSVDNYSKLDSVRVNTQSESGQTFTSFVDIVKASSIWDFMFKSVNSDGTYGDFVNNQFGVVVKGDYNIPQIVHIYDSLLTFDDITSQADTSTTDSGAVVGQQFGVGRSYGQSNKFRVVNKDGNYIMLMSFMWATPQVCYKNGVHHLHDIIKFSDLYQPSFDNYAMQPRLQEQVNSSAKSYYDTEEKTYVLDTGINPFYTASVGQNVISRFSPPSNNVIGYQPSWSDYKTDIDQVHGLFRHALDYYTIIREVPFVVDSYNSIASTYVYSCPTASAYLPELDAKQYSLPFAVDVEDSLQIQLRIGCTITRAMSKNVRPNVK